MSSPYSNDVPPSDRPLLQNPLLGQQTQFEEEEDELDFRQIGHIVRRRGLWMLLVGTLVGGLVGWKLVQAPPVYKESFQLLIQPPNTDIGSNPLLGNLGQLSQLTGGQTAASYYDTQIKVLMSNSLLLPLVDKIKRRKEFFKNDEQRQTFNLDNFIGRLKVSQSKDTQIVEVSYQSSSPKEVKFVLDQLANIYLEYTIKEQTRQSELKVSFLDQQIPIIKRRILALQNRLEQFRLQNDFIDPQNQGEVIADGLKELNKAKQQNEAQLQDAISLYQGLRKQLGISQADAIALNALTESPRYMNLLTKLREVDTKLAKELTRFTEDNFVVQQLKEERQKLMPLLQQEAKVALRDLPVNVDRAIAGFVSPNSIRQSLTQQLLVAANQVQQLQARQQSLNLSEQKNRKQVQNFAHSAAGYGELAGQLEIENQGLASLLMARQALQIDAAKRFSPWRLVSEIRAPEKPKSQLIKNLLLSLVAGGVAGITTGLLMEALDRAFHSSEELMEETNLTVLGTIPDQSLLSRLKFKDGQKIPRLPQDWVAFLEAFSLLSTNLLFARDKNAWKSIIVSSSIPGEGKSTLAFYLANSAASMGQKVLLVDGDRYFPQQKRWNFLAQLQQTSFYPDDKKSLTFSEMPIPPNSGEEICPSRMTDNLYVLESDQQSLDPTQLMVSRSMAKTIRKWEDQFDLIIIDAPPILGLSDTKLLASQADRLLLVVRLGKTSRDLIKKVLVELKISGIKPFGLVANGAKLANVQGSYYYSYYRQAKAKADSRHSNPATPSVNGLR